MKNQALSIVALLIALIVAGCADFSGAGKKGLASLEGSWHVSGDLGDSVQPFSWYQTYTFHGNSYEMEGYPPIEASGKLEMLEHRSDSLHINFMPDGEEPYETWLEVQDSVLKFGGKTFFRQ